MASEEEQRALEYFDSLLRDNPAYTVKLLGPSGEISALPEPAQRLIRSLIHSLAEGDAVSLVPVHKELTTQQAADILNVSRPYLIKLLEQGEIPYTKTGTHRRIRFEDLMDYKHRRDDEREGTLAELTRLSQELGLCE